MENLVEIKNGKILTSSLIVSEYFKKNHKDVLRAIKSIDLKDEDMEFSRRNFTPSTYTDSRGKKQTMYLMTEDGWTFLVMGFNGKEANSIKIKFIKAFRDMQTMLQNKNNESWKEIRTHGKLARRELTDVIQEFVEYATSQGSTSAKFYYSNITKMTYKALAMLEKGAKVSPGFRDLLDNSNLTFLAAAELKAEDALQFGMQEGMHYKEIYEYAKNKVEVLAHAILPSYKRISA